jgi:hypothetical protein
MAVHDRHWSDDDLIAQIYEVGPGNAHLDICLECRSRWLRLQDSRRVVLAAVNESQHIPSIKATMTTSGDLRLSAVFALGVLLLLALLLSSPVPAPQPTLASEKQFFSEIYSVIEDSEPRASAAIRGLFESKGGTSQ